VIHLYERNIESAKNWLLNSGIQNLGEIKDIEGTNLNGSFNSWLDLNTNKYPFAYSEITGYAITTLLFLNHIEKNQEYLKRAKLAADWLINIKQNNIFPSIFSITNHNFQHRKDLAYLFDIGMVLNGLTNKFKVTKEGKYLQESKKKKREKISPIYFIISVLFALTIGLAIFKFIPLLITQTLNNKELINSFYISGWIKMK